MIMHIGNDLRLLLHSTSVGPARSSCRPTDCQSGQLVLLINRIYWVNSTGTSSSVVKRATLLRSGLCWPFCGRNESEPPVAGLFFMHFTGIYQIGGKLFAWVFLSGWERISNQFFIFHILSNLKESLRYRSVRCQKRESARRRPLTPEKSSSLQFAFIAAVFAKGPETMHSMHRPWPQFQQFSADFWLASQ